MPRAKYDPNNPYNLLFSSVGYFKVNYADFLYDFRFIYQDVLEFYGDSISPYNIEIQERLDVISQANVKPTFKNRMYIVTNIADVVLAVVDLDDAVFDNIAENFDLLSSMDACLIPNKINMCYVTNMYLFKGEELLSSHTITTKKLAQFMMAFKKENIVNYQGVRDSWYGEPRRRAKKGSSF